MDVFGVREQEIAEYEAYVGSFLTIGDAAIERFVHDELARGKLWPEPLVGLNPSFERVCAAAKMGRVQHRVEPLLPADVLRVYVFMPAQV